LLYSVGRVQPRSARRSRALVSALGLPVVAQQAPELSRLFQHAPLAADDNALAVPKLKVADHFGHLG
jgi:hypothetical protein